MSNVVVIFSAIISHITGIEVMFQYEASDDTGDQMPDQFNVTFSTETKFLTKFNLRRSQSFDVDIPLYTLDIDREGFFQSRKVKTRPRKDIGYYHDTNHKAVFCIKRSSETLSNRNFKFHLLELLRRTSFDLFDTQIPPPEVEKTVRWAVINQSTSRSDQPSRRRRNAMRHYYVDVVALIDKIRFQWFLQQAKQHYNNSMQSIQEHYAMMFSGLDMFYNGINHPNYTVHIRLCKIFVFQKPNASIFIDKYASDDKLYSPQALKALENFFVGVGREIVGFYDHVILFTGYDLFKYDNSGNKIYTYAGSTYVGTMCRTDGTSCAVIEDHRGPDIRIIAHELGHSLSAKHDGDGNDCSNSDRYIMNNGLNRKQTPETKFNPWRFSTCSVKYFTKFLTENPSNSRRYECLAYAIETSANIPDVSNKLLGQFIKPNQQCQLNYGKDSYYCKGAENTEIEDICHSMYCRDPLNSDDCILMEAYIGTTCGDGKICLYGKCVSVPFAPQVDETCLFGDTKEDHCKSLISKFVGNCYQKAHYDLCCGTCNNMSRPIRGCEYGDKKENCQTYHCAKEKETCCGTCNYGTPFTTITRRNIAMRPTSAKPLLIRRSPKVARECVLGEPDLKPELCTSPSVCQTQPLMCCNYCNYNSGAIFHLYDTWIYRCFYIHCIFLLSKQMSA
nr:ADAM family mig-17-like; partial [Biomphalaria glabrata]